MLKVLAIVPCPRVFGLQITTLRFFERFSGKVQSHFLVTRWTDGEFSRRLDELSIPYTYSWFGMFSRKLDWVNLKTTIHCLVKLPRLYVDFVRLIRSYRPDVIYTAGYHELILLWPVLLLLHIPVVYHVRNPLPLERFYRWSFLFWGANVNHYIAVSHSVGSTLSKLGVDSRSISLLYNGVDVSQFQPVQKRSPCFVERYGWPDAAVIVGMTGQMNEAKGHYDFLQAARVVHEKHPEVRFVIGGKQEGSYFRRLQEQVAEHNLGKIVAFSGWQDDMRSFYSGVDVFVLPSGQDTEGLPRVIAEAMASGLAVVATRSGGAGEIVENGKTGILVERQSPHQLAGAIESLVTSPTRRTCMGKAGRLRVEQFFDLSKQTGELERILKGMPKVRNQ